MKRICIVFLISLLCIVPTFTSFSQDKKVRYLEEIFQTDQLKMDYDVVYKSIETSNRSTLQLEMDIISPIEEPTEKRPLLVWIHGGGFVSGSKENMRKRCLEFAQLGYVTCTINYRLAQDLPYPFTMDNIIEAAVDDSRDAIDWLIKNASIYGIDENTILVGGSSAGAITSCHVAYDDREWDNKERLKGIISLWGGILPTHSADFELGLITYDVDVDENECSPCIIHGAMDPIVPVSMAYALEEKCSLVGIPCTMKIDPEAGHGVRSDIDKTYHSIEPLFLYICMQ
ncbi:MAG: alpha/beta hydrolase [Caldisericia bacterium]|nr:alpha/beta hydrolase [Caldisericia bacterium]MDD4614931.1 alpha/beta hydrolase [Caldisericia bacterium]